MQLKPSSVFACISVSVEGEECMFPCVKAAAEWCCDPHDPGKAEPRRSARDTAEREAGFASPQSSTAAFCFLSPAPSSGSERSR